MKALKHEIDQFSIAKLLKKRIISSFSISTCEVMMSLYRVLLFAFSLAVLTFFCWLLFLCVFSIEVASFSHLIKILKFFLLLCNILWFHHATFVSLFTKKKAFKKFHITFLLDLRPNDQQSERERWKFIKKNCFMQ